MATMAVVDDEVLDAGVVGRGQSCTRADLVGRRGDVDPPADRPGPTRLDFELREHEPLVAEGGPDRHERLDRPLRMCAQAVVRDDRAERMGDEHPRVRSDLGLHPPRTDARTPSSPK